MPPTYLDKQIELRPGVLFDSVPFFTHYGDVTEQPAKEVTVSAAAAAVTVRAVFRSSNPRNNLRTQGTFLTVERLVGEEEEETEGGEAKGQWKVVLTDGDWETKVCTRVLLHDSLPLLRVYGVVVLEYCHVITQNTNAALRPTTTHTRFSAMQFKWGRHWSVSSESYATIEWDVPPTTPAGTYRLRHLNTHKSITGTLTDYQGVSDAFTVKVVKAGG